MKPLSKGKTGYGLLIEYDAGFINPSDNTHFIREMKEGSEKGSLNLKIPKLYGVMQKYGVENKNGRIYPEALLRREVENYMKLVNMGASAGHTDHPDSAIISIKEVSMRVTNLWWEGRNLMGEIYLPITKGYIETGVISHPADKVAHDIMHGFQYGVSSRGVGSLESKGGKNIVQDDFELICWDFVTTPSTNGSWIFSDKSKAEPFKESLDVKGFDVESDFDRLDKNSAMWDYMLKGKNSKKFEKINNVFNNFLDKF
jgi:hypothetical protein